MKFTIHGKTSIRTFKRTLLEQFGLSLKVHRGFSMGQVADDDMTVAANRSEQAEGHTGEFELHGNMKVGTAEQAIRDAMGFAVQILDASGSLADNEVTIGSIRAAVRPLSPTVPPAPDEGVEIVTDDEAAQSSPPPPPTPAASPVQTPVPQVVSAPTPIAMPVPIPPTPPTADHASPTATKNRFVAAALAFLLGWVGAHKFYLGYRAAGLIHVAAIVVCLIMTPSDEAQAKASAWTTIGGLLVLFAWIEGIIYLTKSKPEFDRVYVHGSRQVF